MTQTAPLMFTPAAAPIDYTSATFRLHNAGREGVHLTGQGPPPGLPETPGALLRHYANSTRRGYVASRCLPQCVRCPERLKKPPRRQQLTFAATRHGSMRPSSIVARR